MEGFLQNDQTRAVTLLRGRRVSTAEDLFRGIWCSDRSRVLTTIKPALLKEGSMKDDCRSHQWCFYQSCSDAVTSYSDSSRTFMHNFYWLVISGLWCEASPRKLYSNWTSLYFSGAFTKKKEKKEKKDLTADISARHWTQELLVVRHSEGHWQQQKQFFCSLIIGVQFI